MKPVYYEYLKNNSIKIHFFGLGFIQVKINDEERWHFYSPELNSICPQEDIHDHRYDFGSLVVKGVLSQELYTIEEVKHSQQYMRFVSCDLSVAAPIEITPVKTDLMAILDTGEGSRTYLGVGYFHKVLPVEQNTITFVMRGPKLKEFARVITSSKELVCPFSKQIPEDELWKMVKRIIED